MRRINERWECYTYSACAWSLLRPLLKRLDHSGIRRATRVSNWNDLFSISVLRLKYRWYVMKLLLFCRLMWEGVGGRGCDGVGRSLLLSLFFCIRAWYKIVLYKNNQSAEILTRRNLHHYCSFLFKEFTLFCAFCYINPP